MKPRPILTTEAYFERRAPRYRRALQQCPLARVLDYLPYAAAIIAVGLDERDHVRVCDAFGGTGFLSKGLRHRGFHYLLCDSSKKMVEDTPSLPDTEAFLTQDDFADVLDRFGGQSFDLVVTHGGLHHAIYCEHDVVDHARSRRRQLLIVERLAKLVAPGGMLVVADIPESPPTECQGVLGQTLVSIERLSGLIGPDSTQRIIAALGLHDSKPPSLAALRLLIDKRLFQSVPFSIPRHYFDEFVSLQTELGHVALYPDFEELDGGCRTSGLTRISRINFHGPWLFTSNAEAGWFFREMFSIGPPRGLHEDPHSDQALCNMVGRYLGLRANRIGLGVNWGVTYAVYTRGLQS